MQGRLFTVPNLGSLRLMHALMVAHARTNTSMMRTHTHTHTNTHTHACMHACTHAGSAVPMLLAGQLHPQVRVSFASTCGCGEGLVAGVRRVSNHGHIAGRQDSGQWTHCWQAGQWTVDTLLAGRTVDRQDSGQGKVQHVLPREVSGGNARDRSPPRPAHFLILMLVKHKTSWLHKFGVKHYSKEGVFLHQMILLLLSTTLTSRPCCRMGQAA